MVHKINMKFLYDSVYLPKNLSSLLKRSKRLRLPNRLFRSSMSKWRHFRSGLLRGSTGLPEWWWLDSHVRANLESGLKSRPQAALLTFTCHPRTDARQYTRFVKRTNQVIRRGSFVLSDDICQNTSFNRCSLRGRPPGLAQPMDNRCEDGRFLESLSCVTIHSSPDNSFQHRNWF